MAYELAQQIFENLVAFRFRTTLNLQTGDAKRPGAHLFNLDANHCVLQRLYLENNSNENVGSDSGTA